MPLKHNEWGIPLASVVGLPPNEEIYGDSVNSCFRRRDTWTAFLSVDLLAPQSLHYFNDNPLQLGIVTLMTSA